MPENKYTPELFDHPFSAAYWKAAVGELHSVRTLVFAALMIALRIALKPFAVPVAADLKFGLGFFVNAYGAMVMGPVLAALAGIATDTLGYLVRPDGVYFPLFALTEMAGSLVFALFLYRARVTVRRVTLSRFAINFFVNVVLTTPVMMVYYSVMLGKNYAVFNLVRIVKNLVLFPAESAALVFFLRALIPATRRVGFNVPPSDGLKFTKKDVLLLAALFVLGGLMLVWYLNRKR